MYEQNYYEKYLSRIILKPYIQYLSKFCILKSNDSENNHDGNSNMMETKWFQTYNFVMTASQTFNNSLKEVRNYFN